MIRTSIPESIKQSILLRSKRRCPLCFIAGKTEPQEGSIAHIDRDLKDEPDNLVYLCSEHHQQFDQGSAISISDLKKARASLYSAMKLEEFTTDSRPGGWQAYEKLIVDLVRSAMFERLGDFFTLLTNSLVSGSSGVSHQVDLEIRFNIAGINYLTIFDIKHRRSKLGAEDILLFAAKADDVGADKRVIVSSSGFSSTALQLGRAKGLTLFHVPENSTKLEHEVVDE